MQTPTRPSAISRRVVSTPNRNGLSPSTSGPTILSQSVRSAAPSTSRIGRSVTSSGLSMFSTPKRPAGGIHSGVVSNQSILEEDTAEDLAYQRERKALANQIKNLQRMLRDEKERADREANDRRELEILVDQTQMENKKCLEEKEMWQDYSKRVIAEGAKQLGPNWIADSDLAQLPSIASSSRRIPLGPTHANGSKAKANRRQSWYGLQVGVDEGEGTEEMAAGKETGSVKEKEVATPVEAGGVAGDVENALTLHMEKSEFLNTESILIHLQPALLALLNTSSAQQTDLVRSLISNTETARHETEENENTLRALRESREREERKVALRLVEEKRDALVDYLRGVNQGGEEREGRIREMLEVARDQATQWHEKHADLQAQIGMA